MGHDHHFLGRLERVAREQLEYALGLYRDHLAVRHILEQLHVARDARVALAIGSVERGPYIVLAGDGGFVTCLGEGMRTGGLLVVPRAKTDDLRRHHEENVARSAVAGQVRRERESDLGLFTRLFARSNEMCRDEASTLASFAALMARSFFAVSARAFIEIGDDIAHLSRIPKVKGPHLENARTTHTAWWFSAHAILFAGVGTWDMREEIAAATERGLAITRPPSMFGSCTHIARCAWSTSSWVGLLEDAVADELVASHVRAWRVTPALKLGLDSLISLGVVAIAHPSRRDAVIEALREGMREARPDEGPYIERVIDVVEQPDEAMARAVEAGQHVYQAASAHLPEGDPHRFASPDLVPDALALTALLGHPGDLGAANVAALIDAIPFVAKARLEDFYFERDAARKVCKPWTLADTTDLVSRYGSAMVAVRAQQTVRAEAKPGRNDPCSCGSGLKYKRCCGRS